MRLFPIFGVVVGWVELTFTSPPGQPYYTA
jgi:hypothetical protein